MWFGHLLGVLGVEVLEGSEARSSERLGPALPPPLKTVWSWSNPLSFLSLGFLVYTIYSTYFVELLWDSLIECQVGTEGMLLLFFLFPLCAPVSSAPLPALRFTSAVRTEVAHHTSPKLRTTGLPPPSQHLGAYCMPPPGGGMGFILHKEPREDVKRNNGARPQLFKFKSAFFRGASMNGGAASLILGTLKTFFISCVLSSSSVITRSAPRFFSLSVSFWRSGLETKHEPRSHRLTFSTKGSRDCSATAVTACFFAGSWDRL